MKLSHIFYLANNKDIMECPICYDTETLDTLKCLHSVCRPCISKLQRRVCPICRTPIDDVEETNVVSEESIEIDFESIFVDTEVYSYEVDFTFQRRPVRRQRRRRTRERNREVEDIITQIFSIPINFSLEDLNIREEPEESEEKSNNQTTSRSDRKRQMCRHKRNRWISSNTQTNSG